MYHCSTSLVLSKHNVMYSIKAVALGTVLRLGGQVFGFL